MKLAALFAAALLVACGQTGSLYLPDEEVETPVDIRTPATTPAGAPPAPVPEPDDDEDEQDAPPPGS
jgi:predicted small lipoprotein YifL